MTLLLLYRPTSAGGAPTFPERELPRVAYLVEFPRSSYVISFDRVAIWDPEED